MKPSRPKTTVEKFRDEMGLHKKILSLLEERGPLSINEISQAIQWPNDEIMMYVMAMRKFGLIEEAPKERRDRYFKYGKK